MALLLKGHGCLAGLGRLWANCIVSTIMNPERELQLGGNGGCKFGTRTEEGLGPSALPRTQPLLLQTAFSRQTNFPEQFLPARSTFSRGKKKNAVEKSPSSSIRAVSITSIPLRQVHAALMSHSRATLGLHTLTSAETSGFSPAKHSRGSQPSPFALQQGLS